MIDRQSLANSDATLDISRVAKALAFDFPNYIKRTMDRSIQKRQEEISDAALLPIAREFVQQHNVVGIAMLHRHLNLPYGCAARLLNALEAEGAVGPAKVDGRKVLKRGTEPPST